MTALGNVPSLVNVINGIQFLVIGMLFFALLVACGRLDTTGITSQQVQLDEQGIAAGIYLVRELAQ